MSCNLSIARVGETFRELALELPLGSVEFMAAYDELIFEVK